MARALSPLLALYLLTQVALLPLVNRERHRPRTPPRVRVAPDSLAAPDSLPAPAVHR